MYKSYRGDLPSIRLLVLGDSGVGKTSLVSRIARDQLPSNLKWTQQANVEIMVFPLSLCQSTRCLLIPEWLNRFSMCSLWKMHICGHKSYFIEFIDVSGLISSKIARQVYYKSIDGIVLVFDTNNKKSYHNLRRWLKEYYDSTLNQMDSPHQSTSYFPQIIIGSQSNGHRVQQMDHLPLITIGNKIDLHSDYKVKHVLPNEFKCGEDYGYQFTFMSALLAAKYQRAALSQFQKYLNSIITKIEQLKSKHSIHSVYSPVSVTSSGNDNALERDDSASSLESVSRMKSKRRFFSFWWFPSI